MKESGQTSLTLIYLNPLSQAVQKVLIEEIKELVVAVEEVVVDDMAPRDLSLRREDLPVEVEATEEEARVRFCSLSNSRYS